MVGGFLISVHIGSFTKDGSVEDSLSAATDSGADVVGSGVGVTGSGVVNEGSGVDNKGSGADTEGSGVGTTGSGVEVDGSAVDAGDSGICIGVERSIFSESLTASNASSAGTSSETSTSKLGWLSTVSAVLIITSTSMGIWCSGSSGGGVAESDFHRLVAGISAGSSVSPSKSRLTCSGSTTSGPMLSAASWVSLSGGSGYFLLLDIDRDSEGREVFSVGDFLSGSRLSLGRSLDESLE